MKYIRIFFTFLGYCTFICLVGAATFWYIGQKKAQSKAQANPDSTVVFQDNTAPTAPAKDNLVGELQEIQPISIPASRDHLVDANHKQAKKKAAAKPAKPVAAAKPAKIEEIKPVTHTAPAKSKPVAAAKPSRAPKKKATAKSAPAPAMASTDTGSPVAPCTLQFRATDNGSSPRTGRGVVNMDVTTDLERAAMRRVKAIQEPQAAADKIRNPQ